MYDRKVVFANDIKLAQLQAREVTEKLRRLIELQTQHSETDSITNIQTHLNTTPSISSVS